MKNPIRLIKISSLIYLLASFFAIPYITVLGGIFLSIGIILLSYSFLSIEQLQKKKVIITLLAIISIFFGVIVGIMLFIALDEISSFKTDNDNAPPEDEVTSEAKRIDLLLKIGLVMILISGVLFATTSWDVMPDIIKVFGLILMGFIFLGLSKFSEEKLKIEKTTKAYYILGMSFFLLTWVGIGVFASISPWFSYTGEGKNLVYLLTFILLSTLLFLINKKFPAKEYEYFAYISIYLSIYHLLTFIGCNLLLATLVISVISLLINIFLKDNKFQSLLELTNLISYLYTPIIITQSIDNNVILVIFTSLVSIVNVLYLSTKTNDQIDNILAIIISYVLILTSIFRLDIESGKAIIIFIFTSLIYVLINHNKFNTTSNIINTNQILYNIVATISIICMNDSLLQQIIFSVLYGIINYINCYITNEENSTVDFYYQPVIIFMVISYFINILSTYLFDFSISYNFIVTALIYALIYQLETTEKIKKLYFVSLIVMTVLSTAINVDDASILVGLFSSLLSGYIYFNSKDFQKEPRLALYIFMLINIFIFGNCFVISSILSQAFSSLFVLVIYGTLTYIMKEKNIRTTNYIALAIPFYTLVNSLNINYDLQVILNSVFTLYILFLVVMLIIKDKETKDIVAAVGTAFIALGIIVESSIIIGIYIGILGISVILLTYNKQSYKKLFYCGVGITIINIIIQLGDYWAKIPLWLYLLVVGGGIVAFVTYKEANRKNSPETIKKEIEPTNNVISETIPKEELIEEQIEEPVETLKAEFCPFCGTKNPGGNYCLNCGKYLIIPKKKN